MITGKACRVLHLFRSDIEKRTNMNYLEELRRYKHLTQKAASEAIGISLRSYIMYEHDPERLNTKKYRELVSILEAYNPDKLERRLTLRRVKQACTDKLYGYNIKKCVLLGDYKIGDFILDDELSFIIVIPDGGDFTGELAAEKLASVLQVNVNITCIGITEWRAKRRHITEHKITVYTAKPTKNVHTATKKSLL